MRTRSPNSGSAAVVGLSTCSCRREPLDPVSSLTSSPWCRTLARIPSTRNLILTHRATIRTRSVACGTSFTRTNAPWAIRSIARHRRPSPPCRTLSAPTRT
uniref:(northern house mosquito) hypothetical protein n=1 Tax=Culex pipiens TaxID=7175 RepID=A0A8D8AAJ5_CULPI